MVTTTITSSPSSLHASLQRSCQRYDGVPRRDREGLTHVMMPSQEGGRPIMRPHNAPTLCEPDLNCGPTGWLSTCPHTVKSACLSTCPRLPRLQYVVLGTAAPTHCEIGLGLSTCPRLPRLQYMVLGTAARDLLPCSLLPCSLLPRSLLSCSLSSCSLLSRSVSAPHMRPSHPRLACASHAPHMHLCISQHHPTCAAHMCTPHAQPTCAPHMCISHVHLTRGSSPARYNLVCRSQWETEANQPASGSAHFVN